MRRSRRLRARGPALGLWGRCGVGGRTTSVMDDRVDEVVGVPDYQIGRGGVEGDEAAIGADRGPVSLAIRQRAGGVDAHPLGGAGLAVIDEHVVNPSAVSARQPEDYEAAVGADRRQAATV